MNEEIKGNWVSALKSGDYTQGDGHLKRGDKYCCLGVLCDLAAKAGVVETDEHVYDGTFYRAVNDPYDGSTLVLPEAVMEWAGLDSRNPVVDTEDGQESLADLNDGEVPFSEIADIIDEQL